MKRTTKHTGTIGVISVIAFVLFLMTGSLIYYNQLNSAINSIFFDNMQQIAYHDEKTVETINNKLWQDLSEAGTRFYLDKNLLVEGSEDVYDLAKIRNRLGIEGTSNHFIDMYLLVAPDTENIESGVVAYREQSERKPEDVYYNVPNTESKIYDVVNGRAPYVNDWFDNFGNLSKNDLENINKNGNDSIIYYSHKLEIPLKCQDEQGNECYILALCGTENIKLMREQLAVISFNGSGTTSIADINGNYILIADYISESSNNFFTWLEQGKYKKDNSASKIIEKIQNKEDFYTEYTNHNNVNKVIFFKQIKDTDWVLFIDIPKTVLNEQVTNFMLMTLLVLSLIICGFVALFIMVLKIFATSNYNKAQAKIKGNFLSSMSHEIRTPLNGIIGLNHLMKENINDNKKLQDYLQKAEVTSNYLLQLINDILDFSKFNDSEIKLIKNPFNLEASCQSLITIFQSQIDAKKLEFTFENHIEEKYLIGDEVRIKQILINILSNAIKFTSEGGKVQFKVSQQMDEGMVKNKFEIADNGCGMSKKFLSVIFKSFTQENNEVSQGTKGTGLGMAITNLLVQEMKGTITVDSELGVGSLFVVNLPLEKTEAINIENKEKTDLEQEKKLKILVAEDNELNAEVLKDILEIEGITVDIATNGQEAVDMFANSQINEYDVILMDGQMPIIDGFEATAIIRKLNREDAKTVKIFACTANTLADEQQKSIDYGMDGFIPKPINVQELLKTLKQKQ